MCMFHDGAWPGQSRRLAGSLMCSRLKPETLKKNDFCWKPLSECKAQQPYGGRMQPLKPNKLDFRVARPIGAAWFSSTNAYLLRGYSKTSLQALLPCQWLKHTQVPITGSLLFFISESRWRFLVTPRFPWTFTRATGSGGTCRELCLPTIGPCLLTEPNPYRSLTSFRVCVNPLESSRVAWSSNTWPKLHRLPCGGKGKCPTSCGFGHRANRTKSLRRAQSPTEQEPEHLSSKRTHRVPAPKICFWGPVRVVLLPTQSNKTALHAIGSLTIRGRDHCTLLYFSGFEEQRTAPNAV